MARPEKFIDWDDVETRMKAGNKAKSIACGLRIEINTFYDRFKKEFGKGFADYADNFSQTGKEDIEYMQHVKAMEGNSTLLIHLGKVRCKQRDTDDPIHAIPVNDQKITIENQEMTIRSLESKLVKLEAIINDFTSRSNNNNNNSSSIHN